MRNLIAVLILVLSMNAQLAFSQSEAHSKIQIQLSETVQVSDLLELGILLDHFGKSAPNSIDAILSASDINKLTANNVDYQVLIPDVKSHYLASLQNFDAAPAATCGLTNFTYGTMGHYHTFDEVTAQLDLMKSLYPNLITAKDSIGTSIEGRAIYAVKISDNPDSNEIATESSVYFDALHHSREPLSMESIIYYMWWLLENYGTDDEATYLLDNRQLHFIPVVNPDGYVYNQTNSPSGGGMWRKNRRDNGGGNFGVDLNRNYSSEFGNPIGSSSNPSSGSYHGDSAFSEPETRAVRDYLQLVNPNIGFSIHTWGQKFLIAPACYMPNEDFQSYAEFSSEFITNDYGGYGTTFEMLGYSACGITRHYMHDNGIYTWGPELGSGFWPVQSEFCSTIEEFQHSLKYISYVSGSYTRLNDLSISDPGYVLANDTLEFALRVKNRGLGLTADSVNITVKSLNANCTAVDSAVYLGSIGPRSFASGTFRFLVSSGAQVMDELSFQITVEEGGFTTYTGTKQITVGSTNLIFSDDAESGTSNWDLGDWDTTFISFQSGAYAIADSRYRNYAENDNNIVELIPQIDLSTSSNPWLLFNAKWSIEKLDNAKLQVSTNGISWDQLAYYSEHEYWTEQRIDLSNYIGQSIYVRFNITSDNSVQSDGFYFDDFRVVDYVGFTATKELSGLNEISIYPNPSSDVVYVNNRSKSKLQLELYHCTGKLLLTRSIQDERSAIDLSAYGSGIYFIKVQGSVKKVVKY